MTVKEKYNRIQYYEQPLKEIIEVIEVIDPIRNDTKANDYLSSDGVEMVRLPRFHSWLIRTKRKFFLKVQRVNGYKPMNLELSREVVDALSKVLCEKRDWYRSKIEEINEKG